MSDLTPRERAAEASGFPHDITFGELREELDRAWAIVDQQRAQLAARQPTVDVACGCAHEGVCRESECGHPAYAHRQPTVDVEALRRNLVQASIYIANGDFVAAHEEVATALAALTAQEEDR